MPASDQSSAVRASRAPRAPAPPPPPLPGVDGHHLCVLASGSSGNCSVLLTRRGEITRYSLIDLGLSPKRVFAMLGAIGLRPDQLDDCLVTHLDHDHFHAGWIAHGPPHPQARLILSDRHAHAADEFGRLQAPSAVRKQRTAWRTFAFEAPGHGPAAEFVLQPGVRVHPIMLSHDELGVAAFRIELEDGQPGLPAHVMGFATDLGRTTPALVDHFRGVHTLAIESNYCPEMQHSSLRPAGLKDRIMNGSGHLSNQEALAFIAEIEPGDGGGFGPQHVVLLHLSRDCNHPEVVGALHAGSDYALTIASQFAPTRWIRLGHHAGAREARPVVHVRRTGANRAGAAATTPLLWGS